MSYQDLNASSDNGAYHLYNEDIVSGDTMRKFLNYWRYSNDRYYNMPLSVYGNRTNYINKKRNDSTVTTFSQIVINLGIFDGPGAGNPDLVHLEIYGIK